MSRAEVDSARSECERLKHALGSEKLRSGRAEKKLEEALEREKEWKVKWEHMRHECEHKR